MMLSKGSSLFSPIKTNYSNLPNLFPISSMSSRRLMCKMIKKLLKSKIWKRKHNQNSKWGIFLLVQTKVISFSFPISIIIFRNKKKIGINQKKKMQTTKRRWRTGKWKKIVSSKSQKLWKKEIWRKITNKKRKKKFVSNKKIVATF